MIRTVVLAVVIGFGVSGLAAAQGPPDACGPKGDLSADLSNNVAADSRCFEVRMYTARPQAEDGSGGIDELHQRFRDGEVAIFEKHGAEVVAVWQRLDNPNTPGLDARLPRPRAPGRGVGRVPRGPGLG